MRKIFYLSLFYFILVFCQCEYTLAQSPTQLKKKCPNVSTYSLVQITNIGDILYQPCPVRSSIFDGIVDFSSATVTGLPAVGSPLTTKGDLWGFSTLDARVPIGVNGEALIADSTQALGVKWAGLNAGNLLGGLGGQVVYQSALNSTAFLANGVAGQVLQSNGTTLAPSWVTPSAGSVTGTGTTNFFTRWTNGAGGVIGNTPNSWNGTQYIWNNTALTAQFTMDLTPSVAGGLFQVGDFTTTPTSYLAIDQTANTSNLFAGSGVLLGNSIGNGTLLNINDATNSFTFGNTANTALVNFSGVNNVRFRNATSITPTTAAAGNDIGTTLLPFSSLFIGAAATNNIQLTGTATAARVITLPNATGTVQLQGAAGTILGLTVNTIPKATSATALGNSNITDSGTLIGFTANVFRFITGIIKVDNDCAGVVTLGVAGTFDLSTTTCFGLASGTRIVLVTGDSTTGLLTVNGGLVVSSVGAADAGGTVNYWIIDTP